MMLEDENEEPIDIQVLCPIHHREMEYSGHITNDVDHTLTFSAKCKLCLNNVIVSVKL